MNSYNTSTLTFGKNPKLLINRSDSVDTVTDMFSRDHSVSQTYLIEGVRGSGKTVLMTNIAKRLKDQDDWIVINLNYANNLIDDLAVRLSDAVKRAPNLLETGVSFSFAGFGIGIGGIEKPSDSPGIIRELLDFLKKKTRDS